MKIFESIGIFVLYHVANYLLGIWNAQIVATRIKKDNRHQIEHFAWFAGYCLICAPQYWIFNFWFVLALMPIHLSIFAPAYNHGRHLAPFNLSRTSTSILDRTLVKIGCNDLELACFVAELIAVVVFIFSLFKFLHS
jgi:hypothetical protein